ncbi:amidohydrolase [Ruminococcaceae bacterium OttesenSCG-928-I18]|nr:amidohydrolase [Ruminococcaceae bacterium OttesenSCG-928-I18]
MIEIDGITMPLVDAHVHIWNHFHGSRLGNVPLEPLGWGRVRQGGEVYLSILPERPDNLVLVESLLVYMDELGADNAVILQNPCYGDQRNYIREVLHAHPGKFVSLGMLDPRLGQARVEKEMDNLLDEYGFKGFKIEVPDVPFPMDELEYDFLFRKIMEQGAVLALDLGWHDGPFVFNIERLEKVLRKYPALPLVLCHLGVSRLDDHDQKNPYPFLQQTLKLLDINRDHLYFDISGLPLFDDKDEYPFERSLDIFKMAYHTCGTDRLLWGSDMPTIMTTCTYKQTLTQITRHCDFLTQKDYEQLFHKNAEKVYF